MAADPQLRTPAPNPVAEAARTALTKAGGDVARATALFEQAVRADRLLRDALTEPLLRQACYDAVRMQCRATRRQVWHVAPREVARRQAEGARRLITRAETLMAFPLLGGRRLGEATREEVGATAEFYERQAGDMADKANWLRLIAQSVPPGRRVRDVLTDKRLRELREAARHA